MENHTGNLTEEEKTTIKEHVDIVNDTKEVIQEIEDQLHHVEEALKDKDKTNVTMDDQTILDQVEDSLHYIENHKQHLDKSHENTYVQQIQKSEEMKNQLEEMKKEKDKVEQSKPKEAINESNVDDFKAYQKLLEEFLTKYETNLTTEEKASFAIEANTITKAITSMTKDQTKDPVIKDTAQTPMYTTSWVFAMMLAGILLMKKRKQKA